MHYVSLMLGGWRQENLDLAPLLVVTFQHNLPTILKEMMCSVLFDNKYSESQLLLSDQLVVNILLLQKVSRGSNIPIVTLHHFKLIELHRRHQSSNVCSYTLLTSTNLHKTYIQGLLMIISYHITFKYIHNYKMTEV